MARRYDLLVVDLDGTLLGRDGLISPRNREAISKARAGGLQVVIATGRALVECQQALRDIGHEGVVIAAGGSALCDASTGRTLRRMVMPHDLVDRIARSLMGHGHKALVLKDPDAAGYDYLAVGPAALDPASAWWFQSLPVRVRFAEDIAADEHPHDTLRAGTVARGPDLARIAAELRADLDDRVILQHWSAVTASEATGSATHLLEVFSREVNKWTMLERWCGEIGIEAARVAAIGDEINDLEMIHNAGLGVAMGNAPEHVKQAADRVTDRYDQDGLARAIDHILAGRW